MTKRSTDAALRDFSARIGGVRLRAALDRAASEVLSSFDGAGVSALVLKGPALARLLYREGETRGYSDIDLLVAPADLPAARRALAALGYTDVSDRLGIDDVGGLVHADTWVGQDPDGGQTVELHQRLPGVQAPPQRAWETLAAHRTWIDLAGRRVAVLDHEGLAMHLATHAAQHGSGHLKGLADLERGLERWGAEVWAGAARLADEVEATPAFAAGLRLLPTGAALAEDLGLPATPGLEWDLANRASRPRGTFHLRAFTEARGVRARADLARRALFPARDWIVYAYPWARDGGVRMAAAYALHILRSPAWAVRAWRFQRRARRARAG